MNLDDAKAFVISNVSVEHSDIIDAKGFWSAAGQGVIHVETLAKARGDQLVGPPAPQIPLWQEDPRPSLLNLARHIAVQLGVFKASWELVLSGVLMPVGSGHLWYPRTGWTTVAPGSGGMSGGLEFKELMVSHPEHVLRPTWLTGRTELADGDLYLQTLDAAGLQTGIAEALRQSVRCFAQGLFIPAVAMLDAASEGAWLEAGQALTVRTPSDSRQARLATKLADTHLSIRSKVREVCDYWEFRKDLQSRSGIRPAELQDTMQWAGLIRDARNVLHWGVAANIPNNYTKVSTLLLAAINHVKRLHLVATS